MSKISILPEFLINKIAAGEVIERPASIVRELVDNSIDAGAKTISVEVLYGGKKLIKISDDGAGMDRYDASLCFERHATSKIKSEDDLFNIHTLGFRGEAMASIAAVSKVTLTTSAAGSDAGTRVEFDTDGRKKIMDAPPLQGTVVEIRDVFYNTPARRKFLKSISTEASHIIDTVTQKAFAHPEISFSLRHNNSEVMNVSSAKDIKERFVQLYGEELVNEFVELSKGKEGLKLYGFCSRAEFARSTKNYQLVFINRRPVKNPTITHAVYNACRELIPKDRHPAFFLFLDVDPGNVDVNVHPAKREVRFDAPDEVHRVVEFAVKEALNYEKAGYASPLASSGIETIQSERGKFYDGSLVRETLESAFQSSDLQADFFTEKTALPLNRYFYIGESFFAQVTNDGLMIIDQHAAHERVLYEKFLKKTGIEVENLFLPIRVELPAKEFNIIMDYKSLVNDFGFAVEDFGSNNIIVRTLPAEFRKADIKGLLLDMASDILEQETSGIKGDSKKQNLIQSIAVRLACHKSVRGREQLNNEELSQLIADLEKAETPDKCPHGRPTKIFFSLDALRKMFKRK